jgi:hypothetical protein
MMTMSSDLLAAPLRLLRSTAAVALRVVATLVGFAFMLGMVLLGLVAGTLLLLWTLLRGGRPVLRFRGMPPRNAWRAPANAPGEVVDIEAREVEPPRRS